MSGAADHDDRRRRRHRRPRAVRGRPGRARRRATSSSTRRPPCRSTRRSTRPSRSTCSARRASPSCCSELGVTPHLVSVSTCYVAGNRRGTAPEELVSAGPFDLGLSWRAEVAAARRLRGDSEAASRQPDQLVEFRPAARTELGAAGAPALAAKTEQLRERWVRDRLVEAGRARAASVGWPDAYAFTKALGEQALTDSKGDVPVSIVRPSIIESAWAEPRPGWIRGFRMAEPVIISYARGLLREFPGVPEGTVDVIPVDLVVAAIIAVAALGPEQAPADHPGRVGRRQPAEVQGARRQRQRLVHRAPALRQRGPADRRARVPLPRPRPRAGAADPGQGRDHPRREAAAGAAAARQAGRVVGQARDQADGGRAGAGVRRAVRPLHRVRGDLPGRQPAGDVGRARRRRPGHVRLRPARRRLADVHPRDPPAVDRPARPRQDGAGQDDAPTAPAACAARCSTRPARSPRSTSRTR